jgi:translation initiation factor IF-1
MHRNEFENSRNAFEVWHSRLARIAGKLKHRKRRISTSS